MSHDFQTRTLRINATRKIEAMLSAGGLAVRHSDSDLGYRGVLVEADSLRSLFGNGPGVKARRLSVERARDMSWRLVIEVNQRLWYYLTIPEALAA